MLECVGLHEALGERPAGSKDEHRDCTARQPEFRGYFAMRQPPDLVEDECPTLLLGKPPKHLPQLDRLLHWLAGSQVMGLVKARRLNAGSPGAVSAHTQVPRDGEQPSMRCLRRDPSLYGQPGVEECLLENIGCIFPIAQVPQAEVEYSTGVLVVESAQINIDCVTSRRNGGRDAGEPCHRLSVRRQARGATV